MPRRTVADHLQAQIDTADRYTADRSTLEQTQRPVSHQFAYGEAAKMLLYGVVQFLTRLWDLDKLEFDLDLYALDYAESEGLAAFAARRARQFSLHSFVSDRALSRV